MMFVDGSACMQADVDDLDVTIAALDGSFDTTLKMAESASVTLVKPGPYRYACKEHPWAVGELTIE